VKEARKCKKPLLVMQGERDYQVTGVDLEMWKKTLDGKATVTFHSYPTLNHLFIPGEGPSRPDEYNTRGSVPEYVIDDIAGWVRTLK
jgi:fermentation-respiration switch protein FrsA (DUF1100 family)